MSPRSARTIRRVTLVGAIVAATLTLSGCHGLHVAASVHDAYGHGHGHGYGGYAHGYHEGRRGPGRRHGGRRGGGHHHRHGGW